MGCGGSKKKRESGGHKSKGLNVTKGNKREESKRSIEAKIVLLGETGVGKSSLALRYTKNMFSSTHEVTIGGAYVQQDITLANGHNLKLHIWDTGGSERFRAMLPLYYRDAAAAIITVDVSQEKSFKAVKYWVEELNSKSEMDNIVVALAANKVDLPTQDIKIPVSQCRAYAEENNMIFIETSAKSGLGVTELFRAVADQVYLNKREGGGR